jgi:hypothetical protein
MNSPERVAQYRFHQLVDSYSNSQVQVFLRDCEEELKKLVHAAQKPEVYKVGVADLLAKADFFDLSKLFESKEARNIRPQWFVTADPREMETVLKSYISLNPTFTASLFPPCSKKKVEETGDLISTETLLTDEMGRILLSVSNEDSFQCSKCHQWTLRFSAKQTRSGDEMATEQRYCSTCKK